MSNFLNFIEEDTEAKKVLISTMPTKTKTNIKKFNSKIDDVVEKYNEYEKAVKKYIDTKSKSFDIKKNKKDLEEINNRVNTLERVKFVLNPINTPLEKMGFDNLLYQISNYYDFNFNSLNDIINQFLDKFELAGIKLSSDEFDYTCYVREYMVTFLEARASKNGNYDNISSTFEKIYWVNPEIIEHIELNFRKLIKKHEKEFNEYIEDLQDKVKKDNQITDYNDCLEKLKIAHAELDEIHEEDISDIIALAKNGEIDINTYFEDSKVRTTAYSELMIEPLDLKDKNSMTKFYDSLEKLKFNLEEYSNYLKFVPLFEDFKNAYEKFIPKEDDKKAILNKELKNIESKINDKESKLEKLNKDIFNEDVGLFGLKNKANIIKKYKIDSIKMARELYDLYKVYDEEYIKDKITPILNNSLTISDLLHLYYSFDYFKKRAIKKTFDITTYDEIIKLSESFDLFAMNPNNVIINGVPLFEETDLTRVIVNKYRIDNVNLTEGDLTEENLEVLLNKVKFVLRIREIEKSSTSVDKIWFMVQVKKINDAKKPKE